MKAAEFDRLFDEGEVDIVEYLDLSTGRRPGLELERVSVDVPVWMVERLDRQAAALGVSRQELIEESVARYLSAP